MIAALTLTASGVQGQTLPAGDTPPKIIGHFEDWTAATKTASFQTLCYAFTRVQNSSPNLPGRGAVILWATRGRGGVDSVRMDAGFTFAANSAVTVQAGQTRLYFNTAQGQAFPGSGDEAVAAFKEPNVHQITTNAPGPNGAPVTDTFSVRGFPAAHEAIRVACSPVESRASMTSVPLPGSQGRQAIQLQKTGGILVAPVRINDTLTRHFAVDSGAADVSIPEEVVEALRQTGTLRSADFTGHRIYVTADGTRSSSATFRLQALEVGGRRIENVTGHVAPARSPLLLGQSFLSRFRSWSIDNERQVLLLE